MNLTYREYIDELESIGFSEDSHKMAGNYQLNTQNNQLEVILVVGINKYLVNYFENESGIFIKSGVIYE